MKERKEALKGKHGGEWGGRERGENGGKVGKGGK